MCFSSMRAPLVSRSDDPSAPQQTAYLDSCPLDLHFCQRNCGRNPEALGDIDLPSCPFPAKLSIAKIGLYHNTVQAILRFSCQPSGRPSPAAVQRPRHEAVAVMQQLSAGRLPASYMRQKFRQKKSYTFLQFCCDIAIFVVFSSRWWPPPSWFLKIWNFNGLFPIEGQSASLCQNSSKSVKRLRRYGDLTFFFKMAAVRHLGFVGRVLGPPTKTTWSSLSLSKSWLESLQYFR